MRENANRFDNAHLTVLPNIEQERPLLSLDVLDSGVDQVIYEDVLIPLNSTSMTHGQFIINDLRGTDRYLYQPNYSYSPNGLFSFDVYNQTTQRLVDAPVFGNAPSCYVFDPSRNGFWALFGDRTSTTGYAGFYFYSISGNTWLGPYSIINLPLNLAGAPIASFGYLCHPCTTYNAAGNDDYIYLITGVNTNTFARYSISLDQWVVSPNPPLVNAPPDWYYSMRLFWLPDYDPDKFVVVSGNYGTMYEYIISTDTWNQYTASVDKASPSRDFWLNNQFVQIGQGPYLLHTMAGNPTMLYKMDVRNRIPTPFAQLGGMDAMWYPSPGILTHSGNRSCYLKNSITGVETAWMSFVGSSASVGGSSYGASLPMFKRIFLNA